MQSIAILEDNIGLRETIEDYLSTSDKYKVVFSVGNYQYFVESQATILPDFILLDIHLPDVLGIDIIADIKKLQPGANIIIITGDTDKEFLLQAIENGASAYIYKPFNMIDLEKVLDQVNLTGSFLEPEILTKLLGLINEKKMADSSMFMEGLTAREEEILLLIKKGQTYKEIAATLNISFHTVNHHLKNVYQKTNVKSKSELIAKYFTTK